MPGNGGNWDLQKPGRQDEMKLAKNHCWLAAILLAGMFFVSPIPQTTALRNLFLLGLIATFAFLWRAGRTEGPSFAAVSRNAEMLALGALTLWMFIQTISWAHDRSASLSDFSGEWLGSLLVAGIGYGIVRRLPSARDCATLLAGAIALALFAHAAWTLGFQAINWLQTGNYELGSTPYGNYAYLSTPINMAIALLAADLVSRWMGDRSLLWWSSGISQLLFGVTALAVVAIKARNGVITVFVVLALLGLLIAVREWKRSKSHKGTLAVLIILALAAGLFAINLRTDPRWATFTETVAIAWDIETHKAWLDKEKYPLPSLSSGELVEASAYDRIAWARVAMEGIASQPLGFGYGVEAYGRYIKAQYNGDAVSSHSGLLDFTLANGIPGLLMFVAFCALLFRRGWLAWMTGNPWGLALMLALANYCVRIMLDGHFGSFRLKMLALSLGIFYWLTVRKTEDRDNVRAEG